MAYRRLNVSRTACPYRFGIAALLISIVFTWNRSQAEGFRGSGLDTFRYGGDFRLREEMSDNLPYGSRTDRYNYIRLRTRLWGEIDLAPNITGRVRLVNEFRSYLDPDTASWTDAETSSFPDEMVIDNLYLDFKSLWESKLDVRIGRQDLQYGNGRLIQDATALDGSRTAYSDAVKVTWKGFKNTTVDFLAMYNSPSNNMAINSQERNLLDNGATDRGAGIYIKNRSFRECPLEVYYLYKQEESSTTAAKTNSSGAFNPPKYSWQVLDEARRTVVTPESDINTIGFRIMPFLSRECSGNAEVAYQFGTCGENSIGALGADLTITYVVLNMRGLMPAATAGLCYLSGDDPSTGKNEGWTPLWSRWPQYNEMFVYMTVLPSRWSNLMMPYIKLSCNVAKEVLITATIADLSAPADEADKSGNGSRRGMLYELRTDFTLARNMARKNDKLAGHVLAEVLTPGNYYNSDGSALFVRWELSYAF